MTTPKLTAGTRVRIRLAPGCRAPGSSGPHPAWHAPEDDGRLGEVVRVDGRWHPSHPFAVLFDAPPAMPAGTRRGAGRAGGCFAAAELERVD